MDKKKEFAEYWHRTGRYKIKISEFLDEWKKIIMFPNGIMIDKSQLYIDYSDKHGNDLKYPRLYEKNLYRLDLLIAGVINAEKFEE